MPGLIIIPGGGMPGLGWKLGGPAPPASSLTASASCWRQAVELIRFHADMRRTLTRHARPGRATWEALWGPSRTHARLAWRLKLWLPCWWGAALRWPHHWGALHLRGHCVRSVHAFLADCLFQGCCYAAW